MRKYGFTLAEVLITLAIIGVIAALTLPILISNTQERLAITAFKKAMNTLNTVVQLNVAKNGFDYSGISDLGIATTKIYDKSGLLKQSVWSMMYTNAKVDINASNYMGYGGEPYTGGRSAVGGDCAEMGYQIFFMDGTVLCYEAALTADSKFSEKELDATIDTNGLKGPNKLSTCDNPECTQGKSIGDQFAITLRGSYAEPGVTRISDNSSIIYDDEYLKESYAANWAISH